MGKKIFIAVVLLILWTSFPACKDNENNNNSNNNKKLNGNIQHLQTELGFSGCGEQDLSRYNYEIIGDTVIISMSEDFINIFVNLAFGARKYSPFETNVQIIDNVICMYIIDKCDSFYNTGADACYGRCGGNYTFNFVFKYQENINQKYKILLISDWRGYSEEEPFTISEGIINN